MVMGLPVFLYQIVLEKEKRLFMYMKINGMRTEAYWTVSYLFNFCLYLITWLLFLTMGRLFNIVFFTQTNLFLLNIVFIGWGFA